MCREREGVTETGREERMGRGEEREGERERGRERQRERERDEAIT